ncbi:uncharacterized protein [Rutidosis leptorrhynchoides]|uniref:uncharacterized protein n=1 Tax=Rutidosis leptorrhynchoides TaxID=125765 RepID=UPI003A9975A6
MEGLHLAFHSAMESRIIHGVKAESDQIHVSHFLYVDNVIILSSEWGWQELNYIMLILEVFYLVSGLRINMTKYHIFGIGVSYSSEVDSFAAATGTRVGTFPTKYLGVPIRANMNRVSSWDFLVETFQSELSSWKANLLSSGGRLTLVKSVMGSLDIYVMSLFKYPVTILKLLESIRSRFS